MVIFPDIPGESALFIPSLSKKIRNFLVSSIGILPGTRYLTLIIIETLFFLSLPKKNAPPLFISFLTSSGYNL